jgi:hypothetical protein
MVVQNLNFFDKFGKNLNLLLNPDTGIWEGRLFFEEVSQFLFDNENLFLLEKVGTQYKFPTLLPGESLEFTWSSNENENIFFLYDVEQDQEINENFIAKVSNKTVSYSDINPPSLLSAIDLKAPLQINIAFSPNDESKFERTLNIYWNQSGPTPSRTKIAEFRLYGEGVEEDDRFRVWAQNFGIKFLKEDANILKEYDIKEAFPDVKSLNQARKELLVSKEHIYPYIGTYKGLSNFVNILGYKDVLQIKEYWKNVNPQSSYFRKLLMVDISDYLDDGKIDTFDLIDRNQNIRDGKQFRKTEFLAIVYQFTREDGTFDDDGIPNIEETTEFTVNEIFYKLNKLSDKLKEEFLPINVKIRDIIGEFIFFEKFNIRYWTDDIQTRSVNINTEIKAEVVTPTSTIAVPYIRDIRPIYYSPQADAANPAKVLDGFPKYSFNTGKSPNTLPGVTSPPTIINPYDKDQQYSYAENFAYKPAATNE